MLIAIDVETTGIEAGSRLIELAAVAFGESGEVRETFQRLINPGMPLPPDVTAVNGITPDMLVGAMSTKEVLEDFNLFLLVHQPAAIIAHWAQFDTGMISWDAARVGVAVPQETPVICTCLMAKALGETKNNKLTTLEEHYGLKRDGDAHRALSDADMCRQYFMLQCGKITQQVNLWADAGHDYRYTDQMPAGLEDLPALVATGGDLQFDYTDNKGEKSSRTITPYGWADKGGKLMVHGLCHMRKERRTFNAEKMIRV